MHKEHQQQKQHKSYKWTFCNSDIKNSFALVIYTVVLVFFIFRRHIFVFKCQTKDLRHELFLFLFYVTRDPNCNAYWNSWTKMTLWHPISWKVTKLLWRHRKFKNVLNCNANASYKAAYHYFFNSIMSLTLIDFIPNVLMHYIFTNIN